MKIVTRQLEHNTRKSIDLQAASEAKRGQQPLFLTMHLELHGPPWFYDYHHTANFLGLISRLTRFVKCSFFSLIN